MTRKYSSRRLCTQLGWVSLDLMFKCRITNMRPIREFLCYKVGPPTSELNSYLVLTRTALGVREEQIASPVAKVRRGRSVGRRAASLGDIPSSLSSSLVVVVVELLAPVKK